mmetsp:Transcript_91378/g.147583  ORF Transcript_91378/g.147583 Transcript_91378/m.147583 type:complete len:129 (-) Transcript_91378:168-554(-)
MVPATMSCLSTATLVLFSALGANGVPMGHARHLLVYDPSGIHLAILLMAFTALMVFCFLFRGTFLPMKYKKLVEDRDIFWVDHWSNLCKHNKLGTDCAVCRQDDTYQAPKHQQPPSSGQRTTSQKSYM